MFGRSSWPAWVVMALTTVAVVALGDPDAQTPAGATVIAAGAMLAVFITVATAIEYRELHPFPYPLLLLRLAPVPVVISVILSVQLLSDVEQDVDELPGGGGLGEEPAPEDQRGIERVNDIIDVVYAVVAVVGAVAAIYLAQRLIRRWIHVRRARITPVPGRSGSVTESDDAELWHREPERRAVRTGLALGREALLDEDDPRRAIVRAYLAFEKHVRREGFVREPAETQREYAARVLSAGGVGEPGRVTELVELFNAARFSSEPIGAADADAARHHLEALVEA
jgi:Domain of unknown function (DUF4129)